MKQGHTPGPWINNGGRIETQTGKVIGAIGEVNRQSHEDTANARLVTKSPELLGALKELMLYTRLSAKKVNLCLAYDKARDVIKDVEE